MGWTLLGLAMEVGLLVALVSVSPLVERIIVAHRAGPDDYDLSAHERSQALLRDVLDEREYDQLSTRGYLDIASPNYEQRIYRIRRQGGLVVVYEFGKAVMKVCLQPAAPLPSGDVVVLHKLMIQADEEVYLATANHFPTAHPRQCYRP